MSDNAAPNWCPAGGNWYNSTRPSRPGEPKGGFAGCSYCAAEFSKRALSDGRLPEHEVVE